jgi:hypothetical protein
LKDSDDGHSGKCTHMRGDLKCTDMRYGLNVLLLGKQFAVLVIDRRMCGRCDLRIRSTMSEERRAHEWAAEVITCWVALVELVGFSRRRGGEGRWERRVRACLVEWRECMGVVGATDRGEGRGRGRA